MLTESPLNALSDEIIGAAIRVHKELGPGLLESIYETCLTFELLRAGHQVVRQVPFPVTYQGNLLERAFRIDLLVEEAVIVEVKSVERLVRVHEAQVIGYLRFTGRALGLLFNFTVKWLMRDGFRRIVNNLG